MFSVLGDGFPGTTSRASSCSPSEQTTKLGEDAGARSTTLMAFTAGSVDPGTRRVLHPSSTVKLGRRLGKEERSKGRSVTLWI